MVPSGYDEVKIIISSRNIDLQYMYPYFVITNQFTSVVIHKRIKIHSKNMQINTTMWTLCARGNWAPICLFIFKIMSTLTGCLYLHIITLLPFFIEILQYDWLWSGHMIIKEMFYIPIKRKPELARASMTSDVNNQWRNNFQQQII